MGSLKDCLELVGLPQDKTFTIKDAKRAFKKKSYAMLPEKSLGNQNAHGKFEELNRSFVEIMKHKKDEGENIDEIMPGDVDVSKVQIVMTLRQGSVPFWKKVIKQMYPTVIVGAQKKSNFVAGGSGKAIRFVVYWKASSEGTGQPVKVNLVLYENNLLQVSGSGFFLWTIDSYADASSRVDTMMAEAQKSEDDEGISEVEEDGSIVKKPAPPPTPPPPPVKICEAEKRFDMIIEYLENIEEDMDNKFNDLKINIEDLEFNMSDKMSNLGKRMDDYKKKYTITQEVLQDKLDIMHERVCAARQIAGASNMAGGRVSIKIFHAICI